MKFPKKVSKNQTFFLGVENQTKAMVSKQTKILRTVNKKNIIVTEQDLNVYHNHHKNVY